MENDVPRAKPGFQCPLLRKDMSKVCHTCGWWVGVKWVDARTKEWQEKWNCALVATALGQTDVVRVTAEAAVAATQMRDEVARRAISPPTWAVQQIVRDAVVAEQMQMALEAPARPLIEQQ